MSKWNHRVWKHKIVDDEYACTIRETYYNAKGEICGCSGEIAPVYAYNTAELVETLQRMLKAADSGQEILDFDNYEFAGWGDE